MFSTSGPLPFANAHLSYILQDPAPANGQLEGHREDIPPSITGISGPSRAQDPHHVDLGYQGVVDYRPQVFTVSNFHHSTMGSPLTDDTRAIEPYLCIPGLGGSRCPSPRRPCTSTTECSSSYWSMFLRHMSMTFRCR